jgi:hypothetical protein
MPLRLLRKIVLFLAKILAKPSLLLLLIFALNGSGYPLPRYYPPYAANNADTPLKPSASGGWSEVAAQRCGALHAAWGKDWAKTITVLTALKTNGEQCAGSSPAAQLYPAYYNYGVWLEQRGRLAEAIKAYQQALENRPAGNDGKEAALALRKHNALVPPPLVTCPAKQLAEMAAQVAAMPYTPANPSGQPFARLQDGRFWVGGSLFTVRGVNYYPAQAPWRRFLREADLATVAYELDLIAGAGFNTVRIFVHYEPLFPCAGSQSNLPDPARLAFLDGVIKAAATRGLYVLLTLNDLPDLLYRPLYSQPALAEAQTTLLAARYRDEPAILAWDLRNEGDVDYVRGYSTMRLVLDWLRDLSPKVRAQAPNHLLTAGWNDDPTYTASAVDFLSLHHWRTAESLAERIRSLRAANSKPLLIQEIGYATPASLPDLLARQTDQLRAALRVAESEGALGWLIWTAFDFPTSATCVPPACPSPDNPEHHFGLWESDYTPKPALLMLQKEFLSQAGGR